MKFGTRNIVLLMNAVFALAFGLVAYLILKENTYIHIFLGKKFDLPRVKIEDSFTVNLMRRFLADALWAYAMVFALCIVEKKSAAFAITVVCGVAWEFCQLLNIFNGNFEVLDIVTYTCAAGIAVGIVKLIDGGRTK